MRGSSCFYEWNIVDKRLNRKKEVNMRRILFCILSGMIFLNSAFAASLGAFQDSAAFKQYQMRSKNDLSKLIYLLDRFNAPGVEIKLDGNIYTTDKAFPYSKGYLSKNYKKEKAEDWIRKHCYRSGDKNEVIYMRVEGSDFRPVRDILIEELKSLRTFEK